MTLILCTCSTDLKESLFQFMKCSMWWYLGICNRVPQRHMCRRSSRRPWSSSAAIYIYIYLSIPYIWLINTSSTTSISYIFHITVEAASRTLRKYRSPRHNGFRRQDEWNYINYRNWTETDSRLASAADSAAAAAAKAEREADGANEEIVLIQLQAPITATALLLLLIFFHTSSTSSFASI